MRRYRDKPQYTEHCKHDESEYAGSVEWLTSKGSGWVDVYVWKDSLEYNVCGRTGHDPSDYMGVTLEHAFGGSNHPIIEAIRCLLKKNGTLKWERK